MPDDYQLMIQRLQNTNILLNMLSKINNSEIYHDNVDLSIHCDIADPNKNPEVEFTFKNNDEHTLVEYKNLKLALEDILSSNRSKMVGRVILKKGMCPEHQEMISYFKRNERIIYDIVPIELPENPIIDYSGL